MTDITLVLVLISFNKILTSLITSVRMLHYCEVWYTTHLPTESLPFSKFINKWSILWPKLRISNIPPVSDEVQKFSQLLNTLLINTQYRDHEDSLESEVTWWPSLLAPIFAFILLWVLALYNKHYSSHCWILLFIRLLKCKPVEVWILCSHRNFHFLA